MLHLRLFIVALTTTFLLLLPVQALAWRAVIVQPGEPRIDAGTTSSPTAVFATLERGASLTVQLATRRATKLAIYVPGRGVERTYRDGELPSVQLAGTARAELASDDTRARLREPSTGIRVERVGTIRIPRQPAAQLRITASEPVRVLIAPHDAAFELDDPTRTPATVARMRAWSDTPAPGSRRMSELNAQRSASATAGAWSAAFISVAMLAVAGWWAWRGKRRSRERSHERFGPGR